MTISITYQFPLSLSASQGRLCHSNSLKSMSLLRLIQEYRYRITYRSMNNSNVWDHKGSHQNGGLRKTRTMNMSA